MSRVSWRCDCELSRLDTVTMFCREGEKGARMTPGARESFPGTLKALLEPS